MKSLILASLVVTAGFACCSCGKDASEPSHAFMKDDGPKENTGNKKGTGGMADTQTIPAPPGVQTGTK